jgi:hypothetical protein
MEEIEPDCLKQSDELAARVGTAALAQRIAAAVTAQARDREQATNVKSPS